MENNLTRTQRRAIPLILAEKSIEAGCRSARGTREAGRTKQTFYNWLKDEPFKEEYERQQGQIFDLAFDTMKRNVQDGADKLAGLLSTDNPQLLRRVCRDVLDRERTVCPASFKRGQGAHTVAVHSYPGDPLRGYPATPFRRGASPCPQDEGDDGGQCPDRRAGAEGRGEGQKGMMKPLWSFSTDCEGRGMPKKSKNRPFPSTFVQLSTSQNVVFR